jgi:hypothetical protein
LEEARKSGTGKNQEAGMTNRTIALIQAVCISLLLAVVPGTAAPQEQKEPAAQQQPEQSEQPAQQPAGSPNAPVEENAKSQAAAEKTQGAPTAVPPKEEISEYTIKQGDTLWDISNNLFRDPFLWPFIWKANPSIANPDLIYAGNKLVIPSLTPIERALEAPKEQLVEKQVPPEQAAPPEPKPLGGIASAQATRPKPAQPSPEEEAAAEGSRLILPEERPLPIIDKYSMLSAGFVNNAESTDSIVSGEVHEKTTLGYDDVVYVKFGSPENVNIGDKFLIYTPLERVKHPVTGDRIGRLIRGLGILQITAKDPSADVLTARITLSFSEIPVGSLLTPYQEPMLVYQPAEKRSKDISGYIIEVTDSRTINGQLDVVYLDKGRADGVDPGDRFLVYREPDERGFPKKLIGEVQVFLVKDRTSTAVVQKSTATLARGNAVNYEK